MLVTTEMGFMGAVSYPSGERIRAADAGLCGDGECGPRAAELLPDGNIAVAESTGKSRFGSAALPRIRRSRRCIRRHRQAVGNHPDIGQLVLTQVKK